MFYTAQKHLQYPIEGRGQINTLRAERRIQPRALGLLTSLSVPEIGPFIYQPFNKIRVAIPDQPVPTELLSIHNGVAVENYEITQPFIPNKKNFGQILHNPRSFTGDITRDGKHPLPSPSGLSNRQCPAMPALPRLRHGEPARSPPDPRIPTP